MKQLVAINSSSTPDLPAMTALQHLELQYNPQTDPSLLFDLTLLTHLEIFMNGDQFKPAHMALLLRVLPELQQLEHLDLKMCLDRWELEHPVPPLPVAVGQCSALTSSTSLVSLSLDGVHLPDGCGSQLFGHQLPQLRKFAVRLPAPDTLSPEQCLAQEDVNALVESCPHLEQLLLVNVVQRGVDFNALKGLQHLTSLTVGGDFVVDTCAEGLAQLPSLKALTIHPRNVRPVRGISAGGNGSSAKDSGSSDTHFSVEGLHWLMQLRSVTTCSINPYWNVFEIDYYCYSDAANDRASREFRAPVGSTHSLP
jgi:hypothetical protein